MSNISIDNIVLKLTPPSVQIVLSLPTVVPSVLNDVVQITEQSTDLFLANPSGMALKGQALIIRIKDNGTPQLITYGNQYRPIGIVLPTTTITNKTTYLGLMWNSLDIKWDVIGIAQET